MNSRRKRFPKVAAHVNMTVSLEPHTLRLQQGSLTTPSGSRSTFFVNHSMTREQLRTRRIPQRPTHHPRMAGPACQRGNMAVCRHPATRYLADNVQHVVTKRSCLLCRHPVRIVFHLSVVLLQSYNFPLTKQTSLPNFHFQIFTSTLPHIAGNAFK